ncbi:MAG: acyl carrier protein [Nitrosomonas sp.]|nr:acyl carrier protein [Nitrosomonas sp.]
MTKIDHTIEIKKILNDVLGLGDTAQCDGIGYSITRKYSELDSVAIVTIILALEKNFSISIKDDEISAKTFDTLGALVNFEEN